MSWGCTRCDLVVRFAPGHPVPSEPNGWTRDNGSWLCLRCRRDQAVEAAISEAAEQGLEGTAIGHATRRALLDEGMAKRDRIIAALAHEIRNLRRRVSALEAERRQGNGARSNGNDSDQLRFEEIAG